jgi:pimeloyl-ACP methyl ester carboxylesterase
MEQVTVHDGGRLQTWATGDGEPVLLIHGAILAESFRCIERQGSLSGYRLISYHRRGWGGSSRADEAFGVVEHARDASAVLTHYAVPRAHVVGHSYGARVALALALTQPGLVHSLVLLEPGLMTPTATADAPARFRPVTEMFNSGDPIGATRAALTALGGPDYEKLLSKTMPVGWFEQTVADCPTFFDVELPSLPGWCFDADDAAKVQQPTLEVVGEASLPTFRDGSTWLREHLRDVESITFSGLNHLLQMADPQPVARAIGTFLERHPLNDQ